MFVCVGVCVGVCVLVFVCVGVLVCVSCSRRCLGSRVWVGV